MLDLNDPELRENLARAAYFQEKAEDVARDREYELRKDVTYYALDWESLSECVQRPYRTAVAVTLEAVSQALEAA